MDRQLAERMVGAACLLAVLVLVVPSILDGNQQLETPSLESAPSEAPNLRTYTLSLNNDERVPPVPQLRDAPGEPAGTLPDEVLPADDRPAPIVTEDEPAPLPVPEVEKPPAQSAPPASASVQTVVKTPAAPAAGQWYVQLGSFSSQQNAERLVAKLKTSGFEAMLRKSSNGSMSRVLVGPRMDRDEADALARKLAGAGFTGQVTRL